MANILGSDIVTKVRTYVAEPNTQGRWSDTDILNLANDACLAVTLRTDFPEQSYFLTTVAGTQEYTLPEVVAILRVYVAGQLIYPTDIPALQAEQIEVFDQSGPNFAPLWKTVPPANYPVPNDMASPVPATSYYQGQRPVFYIRGWNIGIVPPPAGAYTMQIDAIAIPVPLTSDTTQTNYPQIFLPAIAYYTASLMYSADGNATMSAQMMQLYEQAVGECVSWKRNYLRSKPRRTYLYPYRLYTYGPWPTP